MRLKKELVNVAKKLLDEKSLKDDVKASKDIKRIEAILNASILTVELYNEAVWLDQELIEYYPEIKEMCNTAASMQRAIGKKNKRSNYQSEDSVIQSLITDMFGIYASVLLKHQIVDSIKQFIDSVE